MKDSTKVVLAVAGGCGAAATVLILATAAMERRKWRKARRRWEGAGKDVIVLHQVREGGGHSLFPFDTFVSSVYYFCAMLFPAPRLSNFFSYLDLQRMILDKTSIQKKAPDFFLPGGVAFKR